MKLIEKIIEVVTDIFLYLVTLIIGLGSLTIALLVALLPYIAVIAIVIGLCHWLFGVV